MFYLARPQNPCLLSSLNRRKFLALAGLPVVYAASLPAGVQLLGLEPADPLPGKHPGLTVLNDRPVNAETPAHLLNDKVTPAELMFVRNNGAVPRGLPELPTSLPGDWTLRIAGEAVPEPVTFTLEELQRRFTAHTYQLTLECGGNGRKEFSPPARGNQWSTGAVGCPKWTGVRLKDVLEAAGYDRKRAVYVGYYGKDTHLSGDPDKVVISRGVPIAKALEDESLIAWALNGKPLPLLNGYPLRLVFGGYPASCSGKWLSEIVVRDQVHDGEKMGGQSYRVPCEPVAPGTTVEDEDMCIILEMPVKSLITSPRTGAVVERGTPLSIAGHAWCGSSAVERMEYSIDFGSSWSRCQLAAPANRFAWQHFSARVNFPKPGYYEVWARATDTAGRSQPMVLPGWNPRGYLNNACHRIAVKVV
ncbi:DMSO/TMAO reductase YedYZ molybdopterin-dependent catalytic subunit [Lewinella marina]|uniref:sulfite oxidase n=1 Tax=Neolewinella marina TaxID=438751 RepID=UPI001692CF96|nr:sulfite oxidase [Neolewinella marina]NJB87602.1 DMSO/TMAO reductase YedYZ molybdopterin-dependent catalytic subunit [Neolewinella marina]